MISIANLIDIFHHGQLAGFVPQNEAKLRRPRRGKERKGGYLILYVDMGQRKAKQLDNPVGSPLEDTVHCHKLDSLNISMSYWKEERGEGRKDIIIGLGRRACYSGVVTCSFQLYKNYRVKKYLLPPHLNY